MSADTERITAAESALRLARDEHAKETGALHAKLRWYTENQSLIDEARAVTNPNLR